MLRDRGTIKWTSLMLPEHVKMLKQIWIEEKKETQPILDSQELDVMNQQIIEAYEQKYLVRFSFYKSGHIEVEHGEIVKFDGSNKTLILLTKADIKKIIYLNSIISLEI